MTGVPVKRTMRALFADIKYSYILDAKNLGARSFSPLEFSLIGGSFLSLFTILLIKLCASSIITTELSNKLIV